MVENDGEPVAAAFAVPGRYIQGWGAIGKLGEALEQLGASKALILRDEAVAEVVGEALFEGIAGAFCVDFGGECSAEEIERVSAASGGPCREGRCACQPWHSNRIICRDRRRCPVLVRTLRLCRPG